MVTFFGVCLCRFGKLQYVRFLFYEQDTCAISISSFLSFSRRASEHPRAIKGSTSMGRPRAMKVVGILCIQKLSRWVKVLRIKAHPSSSGGGGYLAYKKAVVGGCSGNHRAFQVRGAPSIRAIKLGVVVSNIHQFIKVCRGSGHPKSYIGLLRSWYLRPRSWCPGHQNSQG